MAKQTTLRVYDPRTNSHISETVSSFDRDSIQKFLWRKNVQYEPFMEVLVDGAAWCRVRGAGWLPEEQAYALANEKM